MRKMWGKRGQSITEYLIVVGAIIAALLLAAPAIRIAAGNMATGSSNAMTNAATQIQAAFP